MLHAPVEAAWRRFGTADGLIAAPVLAMAEDSSGTLWFGTDQGITRSDGADWRSTDSVSVRSVRALLAMGPDEVWCGTASGIATLDRDMQVRSVLTVASTAGGLVSDAVRSLMLDARGHVWVGTDHGVSELDRSAGTWTNSLPGVAVRSIAGDRAGGVWLGTNAGAYRYHPDSLPQWKSFPRGGVKDDIAAIFVSRGGQVWTGWPANADLGGVSMLDGMSWVDYRWAETPTLRFVEVQGITENPAGNIWIGHGQGLSRFDGRTWRSYRADLADPVSCIHVDGPGNIWGGVPDGVIRYDRASWATFVGSALENRFIRAVTQDSTGAVWSGTEGGGAIRYRGDGITVFGVADGLAGNTVTGIARDGDALWFATSSGVSRFNGASWVSYSSTTSGLVSDDVRAVVRDGSGALWFATGAGLSRFAGGSWTTFTQGDGLAGNDVHCLAADRANGIWVGTESGASHFDGATWTTYRAAGGTLSDDRVHAIHEDRSGRVWFGTEQGVSVLENSSWRHFTTADGLIDNRIRAILEDRNGTIWVAMQNWVARYDASWVIPGIPATVPSTAIRTLFEERSGDIWLGTIDGVIRHEPDRVAPQTVLTLQPPALSASRRQPFRFAPAFEDDAGVEYRYALDQGPWSSWSDQELIVLDDLPSRSHELRVMARDPLRQADPTPAVARFTIDADPPAPVIAALGESVSDSILIRGTADDPLFRSFRVEVRAQGSATPQILPATGGGTSPVRDGVLAGWNTGSFPDGNYELRVAVLDALGLEGVATLQVEVDNAFPSAALTSPVRIRREAGGDVYAVNGTAHLYIPPGALPGDAEVTLEPAALQVDTLSDGASRIGPAMKLDWGGSRLMKPAVLDLPLGSVPAGRSPSIRTSAGGSIDPWHVVGGTVAADGSHLTAVITDPGSYGVYAAGAGGTPPASGTISPLSFTPRAFSPSGGYAASEVAIGFTLGASAAVTVKVYNRAGRLVRRVADHASMGPGGNVVRWDGRDGDGGRVPAGLYLVTVEALGETKQGALAILE